MAEIQVEEFKFPDELEPDTKVQEKDNADEIEINIVDDTPPEDRNVEPLPSNIKEDLETLDASKEYSKNVKLKFTQYKKAWHDERREKERALREQQEALNAAQRILDENRRLKEMLHSGEKELLSTYQTSAEMEVDKAKKNYVEAYDSGDASKLLEAQQELIAANLKLDKAKNFRPTMPNPQTEAPQTIQKQAQPAQQLDPKVAAWVSRNTWFTDPKKKSMRRFAEGVHDELEETYGKQFIGTDEYYKRIDSEVQSRFPEEFDVPNVEEKPARQKASSVVAPASRGSAPKKAVTLTKSQQALAKKFNLTNEQYAREVLKLES